MDSRYNELMDEKNRLCEKIYNRWPMSFDELSATQQRLAELNGEIDSYTNASACKK